MIAIGLAPLVMWAIGTVIVRVTPSVYRSEAVVRLAGQEPADNFVTSSEVIDVAARMLTSGERSDPMAKQVLRSNLSLLPTAGPGMIRVAANGHDPLEAQQTLMAVVESYEALYGDGRERLLVYAAPPEPQPVAVPPGMRMVLGCAGIAALGLLLSIPLLRHLESFSAIARASAAAGFPPGGGCLPAVQPAG